MKQAATQITTYLRNVFRVDRCKNLKPAINDLGVDAETPEAWSYWED
jgi:hypothetical protein